MRLALALALLMSMPVDTAAACHRFSVWHFSSPQRCGVRSLHHVADGVRPAPARTAVLLRPSAPVAPLDEAAIRVIAKDVGGGFGIGVRAAFGFELIGHAAEQ